MNKNGTIYTRTAECNGVYFKPHVLEFSSLAFTRILGLRAGSYVKLFAILIDFVLCSV
jgi:hypothetical protein